MKRKVLSIILVAFAVYVLSILSYNVKAATPTYNADNGYVLNGTQKCFFANGTEITIKAREDGQTGATIVWDGGNTNVPSDVNVFGGAHRDTLTYDTKIKMEGGTVKNIFGGGLHESYVGTSEVVMTGGTVTGSVVGGGANSFANSDNCSPTAANSEGSATRVVSANVTITNGTVNMVYGGGEGLSYTKNAVVKISGGSFNYVTAGGSNGYTRDASVNISGGTIGVLQSVNRGEMISSDIQTSGGTIRKFYAGGEEGDANVTGTIEAIGIDIAGNTTVENLYVGTSGGQLIGTNGDDTSLRTTIYEGANVNIADPTQFPEGAIIEYVYVTIDDEVFDIEKGETLKAIARLDEIKNVEGKEFVKFVIKESEQDFDENTPIIADVHLKTIYKDKVVEEKPDPARDNEPPTGNTNIAYTVMGIIAVVSAIGLVTLAKTKEEE